jgi:putative ABC transport system permease protein
MLSTDLLLALRNLRRNSNRTLVALMTVASGIVAYLLAGGFIAWNLLEGREATIRSQLGHVQIVKPGYYEKGIADPYSFLLPANSKEQSSIEHMPGVISLAPRLAFNGLISHEDTTVAFSGEGIDPVKEKPISSRITIQQGSDLISIDERKVLLGEGLAKSLGAKPGDIVVLLAKTPNGSANALELSVAGTFSSITKEYDDYALRIPIPLARKLMRIDGATSWVALLDSTDKSDGFAKELRHRLSPQNFEVIHWLELADFYKKTSALLTKQVNVAKVIIGLIIILTISNTLTMSVFERTTEIGTSLAIGLSSWLVMRLFVLEGILIGIIGGLLGVGAGYLAASAISAIGIPMPPSPGMSHGFIAEIAFTPELAIDAFVLAFITTLLASAFPAWKAGRMNIIDALRYSQ